MPVEAESVGIDTGKQGAVPLQTLVSLDSADSAPSSDFAASLQKWHEKNIPARAISTRQADRAVPKGALPRTPSIKTPRAAEGHVLEKERSSQLARVASCASPSDLYNREKKTTATLSPYPSIGLTKSSAPLQERQPSKSTGRVSVQKQLSMTSPITSIQKQPSLSTPRTPIQDRQPPWRQASGEGKPRPCVTRSMQRKLQSQQSSLPKVREHAANATEQRVPAAAMLGDGACTATGEACTSSSDIQQPACMPGGLASKDLDKIAHQGARRDKTESKAEGLGVAADRSDQAAIAEHGAAWTSKVAAKVSGIEPLPPETHAQPAVKVTIRPVPHNDGSAKSTAADVSGEHSALNDTPRLQGFRLPWTIEAGSSLPQRGSVRSPRLSKEGALGHIDPKALVTKRLPRIRIRYHSGERPKAKPGRSWVFGCFHTPQTTSS